MTWADPERFFFHLVRHYTNKLDWKQFVFIVTSLATNLLSQEWIRRKSENGQKLDIRNRSRLAMDFFIQSLVSKIDVIFVIWVIDFANTLTNPKHGKPWLLKMKFLRWEVHILQMRQFVDYLFYLCEKGRSHEVMFSFVVFNIFESRLLLLFFVTNKFSWLDSWLDWRRLAIN